MVTEESKSSERPGEAQTKEWTQKYLTKAKKILDVSFFKLTVNITELE